MTVEELKKRVLDYKWEFWIDRPFLGFAISLFSDGVKRKYMRQVGVDAEWPATLFQNGAYYKSEEVWDKFADELRANFKKGVTVFSLSGSCEKFRDKNRARVREIVSGNETPEHRLELLYQEIISPIIAYIWIVHGLEHIYIKELQKEAPKYCQNNVEKFIGDISFPTKKNAHNFMAEALISDEPLESIQKKYAWIKSRDIFSPGFTLEELENERKRLRSEGLAKVEEVSVPDGMKELAKIAQELVYFRTLRTDVLYEMLYLARPLLEEIGKKHTIPFPELINYSVQSLIVGQPKKYSKSVCLITYGDESAVLDEGLFVTSHSAVKELKGMVAFKGKISGTVRIVKVAHEIDKVNEGDVLVAPSTAPSYIIGMKKAAAFITDEGGITSHAAIVAREMRKPCIIGTKNATKVLKDGDVVEVDAERGVVKIIDKAN